MTGKLGPERSTALPGAGSSRADGVLERDQRLPALHPVRRVEVPTVEAAASTAVPSSTVEAAIIKLGK